MVLSTLCQVLMVFLSGLLTMANVLIAVPSHPCASATKTHDRLRGTPSLNHRPFLFISHTIKHGILQVISLPSNFGITKAASLVAARVPRRGT